MDNVIGFTGTFNWHGQSITLSTMAKTPAKAKQNMFFKLAQSCNTSIQQVQVYYKQYPTGFTIV